MTYQLTHLEKVLTLCDSGEWGTDPTGTNDIPVLRVADIKANGIIRYDTAPLRSIPISKIQGKTIKNRDVLVVKSSGSGTNVISGRTAIVEGLKDTDFGFANFLLRLRVDESVYDAMYLFYVLQSKSTRDQVLQIVGATTYPNLSVPKYRQIQIPLIPLPEQQRIVRILAEADALRQLRARADTRTNDFIPALFNEMFGDPENLDRMKWENQRVDSFAKVSYGLADKLDTHTLATQGTRIITISNVLLNGTFDLSVERYSLVDEHTRTKARLQKFDLLFNWRNGSLAHVGKTAIWEKDFDGEVLHVSFLLKIRPDLDQIDPYYLWVLMNRLRAIGFYTNSSRFQVNNKFNASELSELKLPLPPLALQREFAARVAEVRAMQAQQARSRQRLEDLFQALLHRAFAGEL